MDRNGFGKHRSAASEAAKPRTKPLKRPRQARAVFTVEAIYQALVRIWRRDGWSAVTTRAVALEAGFAVGTLYDYFPSKQALLSGYIRHCIEHLLARIEAEVIAPPELSWRQRVSKLLALCCAADDEMFQLFTFEVARLEAEVAEPKHHQRAYQELLDTWQRVFDACSDLPQAPSPTTVEALLLMIWGGRRYLAVAQLERVRLEAWQREMERIVCAALQG